MCSTEDTKKPACAGVFIKDLGSQSLYGAQKRTRTSTPLRAPAPEAGASTNSAIWALSDRLKGRVIHVNGISSKIAENLYFFEVFLFFRLRMENKIISTAYACVVFHMKQR